MKNIHARQFKNIISDELFEKLKTLTILIKTNMMEIVHHMCGDQVLELDEYWLENIIFFIIRAKVEETEVPMDQLNDRWLR